MALSTVSGGPGDFSLTRVTIPEFHGQTAFHQRSLSDLRQNRAEQHWAEVGSSVDVMVEPLGDDSM